MSELSGEKIDIIDYDEDPARFVANALSPAKVISVTVVDSSARAARVVGRCERAAADTVVRPPK